MPQLLSGCDGYSYKTKPVYEKIWIVKDTPSRQIVSELKEIVRKNYDCNRASSGIGQEYVLQLPKKTAWMRYG